MIKGYKLYGVKQAIAAFKALEPEVRAEVGEATERTTQRVRSLARGYVPKRTGNLANAIVSMFSKTTGIGRVGVAKMLLTIPTQRFLRTGRGDAITTKYTNVYGRMVHEGSIHNPNPVQFMLLAAIGAYDAYVADASAGVSRACANVSGGRFL